MTALPYVRCVGIGADVHQKKFKKAYDSRMICVLCGEGTVEIGAEKYSAVQGSVFVIDSGTKYRVRSKKNQKIAVINFDVDYGYSHITETVLSVDAEEFHESETLKCVNSSFLREGVFYVGNTDIYLFEDMYRTYLRDDMEKDIRDFTLSAHLTYIVSKIVAGEKKSEGTATAVYTYIVDNVCEKLTAESVAKHFNYSPSYIEKLLRKNYNTSLRQLIIETRLKKALWLLENTSLSCSEISSELGFYSAQHFTQMFRKKYNMKPTDLR